LAPQLNQKEIELKDIKVNLERTKGECNDLMHQITKEKNAFEESKNRDLLNVKNIIDENLRLANDVHVLTEQLG
jgi:predicted  nucleic acid-binding Zn-ribbon protein